MPSSRTAAKSVTPDLTPLIIPGETPDLAVTDKDKGILVQVYFKGTPDELTITQRPSSNASLEKPQQLSSGNDINIVRVTIQGQEVAIRGRHSQEELYKLAESLTN
jgi:hypothetical protein